MKLLDPLFPERSSVSKQSRKTQIQASIEETAGDNFIHASITSDDGRIIPISVNKENRLVFPIKE